MRKVIATTVIIVQTLALNSCGKEHTSSEARRSIRLTEDSSIEWINFPANNPRNDAPANTILKDIVQHLPASYGNYYFDEDPATWGHETSHAIHSHIRNEYSRKNPGKKYNAFYVLESRAIAIAEPNFRKKDVAPNIPQSLRYSRFKTYVSGAADWDDRPLYLMDEWNAYVNGSTVATDLVNKKLWKRGGRDAFAGPMEFGFYTLAILKTAYTLDPQYINSSEGQKLKNFIQWNLDRFMSLFKANLDMEIMMLGNPRGMLNQFLTAADAESMRNFAISVYGQEWFNNCFGGVNLASN